MSGPARAFAHVEATAAAPAILQPGRNCWRVQRADQFYCVQDGADYFRLVRRALLDARHTVFILGWDITAYTDLLPGERPLDAPSRLDKLLAYIARRRRGLRCYILIWDYGSLYTLERDPLSRWRLGWRMPRGIRFGFDDHHPVGASHHQKIVVVDDELAFCGGIDLTGHRWDTSAHNPDEPARVTPTGKAYGPYHEVQAMVTGAVAASLGELARDRWRALGAERMPALRPSRVDLWPADVRPDLTDVDVAISRTVPGAGTTPAIRECEALFVDSIAAASQTIYIESQYFTNEKLTAALAARLAEPDGPEVIVVSPKDCHGWLEQTTMGAFRESVFRQLVAADRFNRLRLLYPAASRAKEVPTFIHSKVMIVDDEFARIGSANYSHRSMGMDTECDLAAEAGGDPDKRAGIRRIRDRLLAEHLGLPVETVARESRRARTLGAFIDSKANADHTLVRLELPSEPSDPPSDALKAAADPDEPLGVGPAIEQLVPAVDTTLRHSPLRIWVLPGLVLAAAATVAWASSASSGRTELQAFRDAIDSIPRVPWSFWIGVVIFVVAGLALVPVELLAIAAGVAFGGSRGILVALIGSLATAGIGYVAGRAIGTAGLTRWMSPRSYRSISQLGARNDMGSRSTSNVKRLSISFGLVLRLSSVASAGSIHLLSGAWRIPFARYIAGTAIGLIPALAGLGGLGALLRRTVLYPSLWNGLLTIGAGVFLIAVAAGLRTVLLIRQFAPSLSSHRDRAEFG
jgi:phospholipase D1/2